MKFDDPGAGEYALSYGPTVVLVAVDAEFSPRDVAQEIRWHCFDLEHFVSNPQAHD